MVGSRVRSLGRGADDRRQYDSNRFCYLSNAIVSRGVGLSWLPAEATSEGVRRLERSAFRRVYVCRRASARWITMAKRDIRRWSGIAALWDGGHRNKRSSCTYWFARRVELRPMVAGAQRKLWDLDRCVRGERCPGRMACQDRLSRRNVCGDVRLLALVSTPNGAVSAHPRFIANVKCPVHGGSANAGRTNLPGDDSDNKNRSA